MEQQNNRKEEEMSGFSLAESLTQEIYKLAKGHEIPDEGIIIPDSGGQVLVKEGSTAFKDRENVFYIFKIPFKIKVVRDGVEVEESLLVCTE